MKYISCVSVSSADGLMRFPGTAMHEDDPSFPFPSSMSTYLEFHEFRDVQLGKVNMTKKW